MIQLNEFRQKILSQPTLPKKPRPLGFGEEFYLQIGVPFNNAHARFPDRYVSIDGQRFHVVRGKATKQPPLVV